MSSRFNGAKAFAGGIAPDIVCTERRAPQSFGATAQCVAHDPVVVGAPLDRADTAAGRIAQHLVVPEAVFDGADPPTKRVAPDQLAGHIAGDDALDGLAARVAHHEFLGMRRRRECKDDQSDRKAHAHVAPLSQ